MGPASELFTETPKTKTASKTKKAARCFFGFEDEKNLLKNPDIFEDFCWLVFTLFCLYLSLSTPLDRILWV